MRDSYKMTELGEIPIDWEIKTFNEFAIISMGQSPSGDTYNQNEVGIPLINGPTEFTVRYPIKKQWTTSPTKLCEPGDILLCVRGSSTGRINISNGIYCIGRGIASIRAKKNYDNRLVEYITKNAVEKILSLTTGSTFPNVDGKSLRGIQVPIASSLIEQQKIASILSTVDEKIEVIDTQITQTRELKKGLMQKLLTRGIGHTKFQDSVLGEIPESWEVSNLESHSHFITKGSTPTTYGFEWQESGITFLRSECVSPNGFILSGAMYISEEANNAMERSKIKGGDILMTITGNVGRTCIYPMEYKEGNINQHIARIRISDSLLLPQFVFQYLSQASIITEYLKITTGQAYPQLSLKQVRETKIPLPSIEEQRKIASILSTIDEKIKIQQEKKTEYQELKKGLMQQLLTGKVRVMESTVQAV